MYMPVFVPGLDLGLDVDLGLGLGLGLDLGWGLDLGLGLDLGWGLDLGLGLDLGWGLDLGLGLGLDLGLGLGLGLCLGMRLAGQLLLSVLCGVFLFCPRSHNHSPIPTHSSEHWPATSLELPDFVWHFLMHA